MRTKPKLIFRSFFRRFCERYQDSSHSALVRVLRELLSLEFPLIDVYPIVSTSLFREACWHSPKAIFFSQYERRMFEYMNSHNFLNAGIFVYLRVFLYRYRISEKGIQYELHRYANTRKKYTLLSAGFVRYVNDTGKGHKQAASRL